MRFQKMFALIGFLGIAAYGAVNVAGNSDADASLTMPTVFESEPGLISVAIAAKVEDVTVAEIEVGVDRTGKGDLPPELWAMVDDFTKSSYAIVDGNTTTLMLGGDP